MQILMLTQWFDPEPFFKGVPFAKELIKLGHKVEILTGFPNYPGGRIYDGYRIKFLKREIISGVPVMRVALYPSHDKSAIKRILNYLSFSVSATICGIFYVKPADVLYVYHPPATIGFPAIVINLLHRIPFVYDIQDLWPDTLLSTGMIDNNRALSLIDRFCKYVYSKASKIVVLSPGFKKTLIDRGVLESKVEVIYNWCDDIQIKEECIQSNLKKNLGMNGKFNVLFAGTMGKAQALDAVLDAAALVENQLPDIQFVFVGGGVDVGRLKQKTKDLNLKNVLFIPQQPISEIGKYLNLADVLLVHLKNDPLFEITIPSKTQAYMATGKPILMGVKGSAAELVKQAGSGLSCIPQNPKSIARAVEKFYNMSNKDLNEMGIAGKRFYQKELSLSNGVKRFEKIFQQVKNHEI
jgi:glycosyltransferase involved in cell wall biosynthesis